MVRGDRVPKLVLAHGTLYIEDRHRTGQVRGSLGFCIFQRYLGRVASVKLAG